MRLEIRFSIFFIFTLIFFNIQGFLFLHPSQYENLEQNYNFTSYPGDNSSWDCIWGFNSSYYGDQIITDSQNHVYISGKVINEWGDAINMFVVKLNASGEELWNYTTKILPLYWSIDILIDSEFNIYTLGRTHKIPDTEWTLLKFNSSGDLLWNRTFIGHANCMYVDFFDKIYVSGYNFDSKTDVSTLFLTKLNETGEIQWNYNIVTSNIKYPSALMVDEFNNTYLAGIYSDGTEHLTWWSGEFRYAADIFYWIYDNSGNLIYNNILDMELYLISIRMFFDKFTHLYLIGTEDSLDKCILFKFNSSGGLQLRIDWRNDAIDDSQDLWRNIAFDSSDNIYCTGVNSFRTGAWFYEFYLVKFNKIGNLELEGAWEKNYSSYRQDSFVDLSSNIFITGSCEFGAFIVKNPGFGAFSKLSYDPEEDPLLLVSVYSVIFGVCILLGIIFYIRFLRKSIE